MSARCALLVDNDECFSEMLRGVLSAYGLEVVVWSEWHEGEAASLSPAVVFIPVDLPDTAGFALCERAKGLWRGIPIVLTTATIPQTDLDMHQGMSTGADAYLDRRTLTADELAKRVETLIGPAGEQDETEGELNGRVAELEEEVRHLRWELDETRRAAESVPFSRDFLRMSAIVSSKEKEVVRLKKEIWAREHKIATSQRILREATARALVATREREQATGHATQLQRELEAEQTEVLRLRLEVQRQASEAEHAVASLARGRKQLDENRRQHEAALALQAEALAQVKEEELRLRSELEAQLRQEKQDAVASLQRKRKRQLKRLRRGRAHALAILHDQLRDLEIAARQEQSRLEQQHQAVLQQLEDQLNARQVEAERQQDELRQGHEHALAAQLAAAEAEAVHQGEELRRLHEVALGAALAGHADAEKRAEADRAERAATESRLQEEKTQAVAAAMATAAAKWQASLEELRTAHASSVLALRQHFHEQLGSSQALLTQERESWDDGHEAALQRVRDELATTRSQAAQLDAKTREGHERELTEVQARQLEATLALEARLREERDAAVSRTAAEWGRKLEAQRAEHEQAFQALREQHQKRTEALEAAASRTVAERDKEHAAVLVRGSEDLAWARSQTLRIEQETAERHEGELTELQGRHVQALTELEARLRAARDQAMAASVAAWEGRLEELRRAHASSLAALRAQHQEQLASLQSSEQQLLARLDAEHRTALGQLTEELAVARGFAERQQEELRRAHDLALAEALATHVEAERRAAEEHRSSLRATQARLRDEQSQALVAATAAGTKKLEELRLGHASAVDTLRRRYLDQLTAYQSSGAQEAAGRETQHQAALSRAMDDLRASQTAAAGLDQETRQRYELELAQLEARQIAGADALEAQLRELKDQAVVAEGKAWESRLEELRAAHKATIESLRLQYQDQLASLRSGREQERIQQEEEHEAALARLGEELAAVRSKAVQPGPAQVQARHAEALKVLEVRLREEKEQAVAAAVAEGKAKLERLRRGHADAMATLRREHQDQLGALDAAQQVASAKRRPAADTSDKVVPITSVTDRSR